MKLRERFQKKYRTVFNLPKLPAVLGRIFTEAFGLQQAVAGGFGAVLMNGVKRGLFSNEAGSGSAPCAAAAAECDDPVKMGFVQALGVLIDTVVICSCTAFLMLLVPQERTAGLAGMDLLQKAMQYHKEKRQSPDALLRNAGLHLHVQ